MRISALPVDRREPSGGPEAMVVPDPAKLGARVGHLSADGQKPTELELERIFQGNDLLDANYIARCGLVINCIGRLRFFDRGARAHATGFLVAPGLLLTNHHVFPDARAAADAVVQFDYRRTIAGEMEILSEHALEPGRFFIADAGLDFAIVAVAPLSATGKPLAPRGYLRLNPVTGKIAEGECVTIIQHPDGAALQIALRENEVTRLRDGEDRIFYTADTAPGSSGSPVFNDSFQMVALHSAGLLARDAHGRIRLKNGGTAETTEGLTEADVVWESNFGYRTSLICARMLALAQAHDPAVAAVLDAATRGGDVLAASVVASRERTEAPAVAAPEAAPETAIEAATEPVVRKDLAMTVNTATAAGGELIIPLQLRIGIELAGSQANASLAPAASTTRLEQERLRLRIPIIFDGLDQRAGFARDFLGDAVTLPMPRLTAAGDAVAAPRLDGGGIELKYHKFSVWMHAARRLALFTASNVDFRNRPEIVDGQRVNRATLRGFGDGFLEEWVPDARIAAEHQLPDVFFSEDRGAFDKGHLVRRDDIAWGPTFVDIQKGNGDTYHVTNCSPQIASLNQATRGVDNWGDLENRIATSTRTDGETCVIYAGPVLDPADRLFSGRDASGSVRVRIPSRYWKIIVVGTAAGFAAHGFVIRQNVEAITTAELSFGANWAEEKAGIQAIEALLGGLIDLAELVPFDVLA